MSYSGIALITALALVLSMAATRWLIGVLQRRGILDQANDRSSHVQPTPRGGGIAIVLALALALSVLWIATGHAMSPEWLALVPLMGLALLSWRDDRKSLPWRSRLIAHGVAVLFGCLILLPLFPNHASLLLLLPVAFVWLCFVNYFNFMDGIDGMAATEAIFIGAGCGVIGLLTGSTFQLAGFILAGAAAGFLVWNWAPARIFMGDVGSIPLGWFSGLLLAGLAWQGHWAAALLLPAYFLTDATLTLLWRWQRGERITQAHRSHWYQLAAGKTPEGHKRVMAVVIGLNAALFGLAVLSVQNTGPAAQLYSLLAGAGLVVLCLGVLTAMARRFAHAA